MTLLCFRFFWCEFGCLDVFCVFFFWRFWYANMKSILKYQKYIVKQQLMFLGMSKKKTFIMCQLIPPEQ